MSIRGNLRLSMLLAALLAVLWASQTAALPIKEYRKLERARQANFVSAAVSMTAYIHADKGEAAKARCILTWYFGSKGEPGPGPDRMLMELTVVEHVDPKRHVEGVILRLTEKVCGRNKRPEK